MSLWIWNIRKNSTVARKFVSKPKGKKKTAKFYWLRVCWMSDMKRDRMRQSGMVEAMEKNPVKCIRCISSMLPNPHTHLPSSSLFLFPFLGFPAVSQYILLSISLFTSQSVDWICVHDALILGSNSERQKNFTHTSFRGRRV